MFKYIYNVKKKKILFGCFKIKKIRENDNVTGWKKKELIEN